MDFLNRAFSQISDLFKSMTPGARLTAGLLLAAIVVSLVYLVNHQVSGPDAFLFAGHPLNAADLPAMEAAFGQAGLNDYELEGTRIRIPRGRQSEYLAALADSNALPANIHTIFEEANNKSNIFESGEQRERREAAARQRQLSLTIRDMRGIRDAAVMYDSAEKGNLKGEKLLTASVAVWPEGSAALDGQLVPGIRNLVASSISGLTPDKVTVLDQNTGMTYSGSSSADGSGPHGMGDQYSQRKREYETAWQEKIREALSFIPGVIVTTNVELDTEIKHEERKVSLDPKAAVAVQSEETNTTSTTQNAQPAGRPGLPAQGGVNAPASVSSTANVNKTEETSDHKQERMAFGESHTDIHKHGLVPQRVTASIGIPSIYYENLWRARNPVAAGQEPKNPDPKELQQLETDENARIRSNVLLLMPLMPGPVPDQTKLVEVMSFQQMPPAPVEGPTMAENTLAWLGDSWRTLGMIGMGLFGLVMLRSMVRSAQDNMPVPPPSTLPFVTEESKPQEEPTADGTPRKRRIGEPTKKDELVDMVREDPDAAANILRNWISNAG